MKPLPNIILSVIALVFLTTATLHAQVVSSGENHIMTNIPANLNGANVNNIVGANRFYNAGITGQSTITASVEAGHIWDGHETLGHVSQFANHSSTFGGGAVNPLYDRHATWVASHIGGRNGGPIQGDYQVGIAPGTDLRSGAVATQWTGGPYSLNFNFTTTTIDDAYGAYFGTADVINSSWGGNDPEADGSFARRLDGFANQNPSTTFVASAGNDGAGPNNVRYPASGYNSIAVAALQNDGANNYDSVAGFSSRGPQSYSDSTNGTITGVRAVIDIAAPGTNLTAAFYGGNTGGNTGGSNNLNDDLYSFSVQGTSFAAPIVAGGAALINSASRNTAGLAGNADSRDARVVKAVLLNSADKIPGWDNGQVANPNGFGGVVTTQSLDWASGAGALNLDQAFDQYLLAETLDVAGTANGNLGPVGVTGWDFGNVLFNDSNIYEIDQQLEGGSDFNVTLDWFRERTATGTDLGQADLDLLLRDTVSGNVISESISDYNVVEHLSFVIPTTSSYQLEVVYGTNTFGGLTNEDYGLAWFGTAAATSTAIPEPASFVLAILGIGFITGMERRRRRKNASTQNRTSDTCE